jgi:hypothetical protein
MAGNKKFRLPTATQHSGKQKMKNPINFTNVCAEALIEI